MHTGGDLIRKIELAQRFPHADLFRAILALDANDELTELWAAARKELETADDGIHPLPPRCWQLSYLISSEALKGL
jgi:hypothetical protein